MAPADGFVVEMRQLSTTAAKLVSKLVKLSIQMYELEGHCATALYWASSKQKKLEQVEKDLTWGWRFLKDHKLFSVVMNPHTKGTEKQKAMNDVLAREMSPVTVNSMNE